MTKTTTTEAPITYRSLRGTSADVAVTDWRNGTWTVATIEGVSRFTGETAEADARTLAAELAFTF